MKAKIIGKCLLGILLLIVRIGFAECDLQVKVLDQNGQACSEVLVGVPFQLHFIAKGDCDINQIKFSSDFDICKLNSLGTIKSVTNVNRVVNHAITHRYLGRIDKAGKYDFGPVKLYYDNQLIGELNVNVVVTNKLTNKNINKGPAIKLRVSKQNLYVGEQFEISLRFYFNDLQLASANLNLPNDFKNSFNFEIVNNVVQGSENRKGKLLNYLEWKILATAKISGVLLLPAVGVVFEKVNRSTQIFMFHNREQHEYFSNTINLQVHDLPKTGKQVQAIGEFTSFTAQVDKTVLEVGKAAQLNLKLEGQGDLSKINIPLSNLPVNIQYYVGNITQTKNTKSFEFVLQGVKNGECLIPAQAFFYFDTNLGQYRTITSDPVKIEVLSSSKQINSKDPESVLFSNDLLNNSNIKPIIENGAIKYHVGYVIPSWLFLSLGFLPILFLFLKILMNYYRKKRINSFKALKKQLDKLHQENHQNLLYNFFINIFVQKFNLSITQIDSKVLDDLLISYNVSIEMRAAFGKFYDELVATTFSKNYYNPDLFSNAQNWLNFLEQMHDQI